MIKIIRLDEDITKQAQQFIERIIKNSINKPKEKIKPLEEKKWTFMVYMAGDNNLEGAGIDDINEMEQAGGSSEDINVIVQFDRIHGYDISNLNWISTKRFYIVDGRNSSKIESIEMEDLGNTNCGDPNVLIDFLKWGSKYFPAKHYAVIIWNHGSGWKEEDVYRSFVDQRKIPSPFRKRGREYINKFDKIHAQRIIFENTIFESLKYNPNRKSIAYDDTDRDFLDNQELEKVLSKFNEVLDKKIDILGMDACLMAMIEIAYQNKNYIDYLIASEQTEPEDGWPYHQIIKRLHENPNLTPEQFSKVIVQEYFESYPNLRDITQSATQIDQLDELRKSVNILAKSLTENIETYSDEIRWIIQNTKAYHDRDYIDLKDFARLIRIYIPREDSRAESVINNIDKAVLLSKGEGEGLSIYMPKFQYSFLYEDLNWAKDSEWDEFIKACIFRRLLIPPM